MLIEHVYEWKKQALKNNNRIYNNIIIILMKKKERERDRQTDTLVHYYHCLGTTVHLLC